MLMSNEVFQRGSKPKYCYFCSSFCALVCSRIEGGSISLRCVRILDANYLVVCKLCNCYRIVGIPVWLSVLLSKGGKSSRYFDTARCETNDANRKNC